MRTVGYSLLQRDLNLPVFEPRMPARVESVTHVLRQEHQLAVPSWVAPDQGAPFLEHVLFALRYEGVDLQVLSEALPRIPAAEMQAAISASPGGTYIRRACYLWELYTGQQLTGIPAITGSRADLFDPDLYVTQNGPISQRWRVHFNGLGNPRYCVTVRKTQAVLAGLESAIFDRIADFAATTDRALLDRAMAWAYLSETDGSFAIEKETASPSKSERFVALLKRAHEDRKLDENYLVELQNNTIDNPANMATGFRQQQNRLVDASAVTYMPPPPALCGELMLQLLELANTQPRLINPIVAAAISSFGFVFLHPFMDGNGRISRFLFHKALCDSGRLPEPIILPVSVALKKHEQAYLAALRSYSSKARAMWLVPRLSAGPSDGQFNGSDSIYRYWDATQCVELSFEMAEEALNKCLYEEVSLLKNYDQVRNAIREEFDTQSELESLLVMSCLQEGSISKNKRKKYHDQVTPGYFERLEEIVKQVTEASGDAGSTDDGGTAPR